MTKELMAGINWSRVSHGFFYRLFKIVEIWQIDGVFFLPALDYVIKKSADQLGPGALGLLSKLQPQDMPKLATPLTWIEYLHRKGG
ncbi:MAG: hypothetical protein B6I30_08820 [Desulfobacteraceae bacterium 4572_187]|nr:MAG: hypothetical protein B6I30_08820 [Desulfobacteraceae bacterium 4572_187]